MSKQGAALSLATAMTPSAAAAASALGAPWRRRQLMQTTRAASTSTTSSSPGPLPGVEPRDATADQAQERVNVQAPQANQHLPDPAAPDAPISLLQRVSESAQVPALPTIRPAACCPVGSADAGNAVASTPASKPACPVLPSLPAGYDPANGRHSGPHLSLRRGQRPGGAAGAAGLQGYTGKSRRRDHVSCPLLLIDRGLLPWQPWRRQGRCCTACTSKPTALLPWPLSSAGVRRRGRRGRQVT